MLQWCGSCDSFNQIRSFSSVSFCFDAEIYKGCPD